MIKHQIFVNKDLIVQTQRSKQAEDIRFIHLSAVAVYSIC